MVFFSPAYAALFLLLSLPHPFLASAGNNFCDEAFFWFQDGTRIPGNPHWDSRFFKKGPCLKVSGIGMTETFEKTLLVIDRTDHNNTYLALAGRTDALAYAEEVDLNTPAMVQRSLNVLTDTFCSSGQHAKGGTFFSVGGANSKNQYISAHGGFSLRLFEPCNDGKCDFVMDGELKKNRWYPTTQLLGDGKILIVGGADEGASINNEKKNAPSVEYYPKTSPEEGVYNVDFLAATLPYNLYPFVHLLPNGLVFMFAYNSYILWNTTDNVPAMGEFPVLNAQDKSGNNVARSYPLSGSSAMFPLSPSNGYSAEIMLCGGSSSATYPAKGKGNEQGPADNKCWRIEPLAEKPSWTSETMNFARVMPIAMLLPDGGVLLLGGTATGHSGIPNAAHKASLTPELYNTKNHSWYSGDLGASKIPRAYHSCAVLLHDSTVFISGSNPNQDSIRTVGEDYPTEFRTEFYIPPYFRLGVPPPSIVSAPVVMSPGTDFFITFSAMPSAKSFEVVLAQPGFSTHGNNHGMRNVELEIKQLERKGGMFAARVAAPPNYNIAPPTFYWMFVLVDGMPNWDGHHVIIQ